MNTSFFLKTLLLFLILFFLAYHISYNFFNNKQIEYINDINQLTQQDVTYSTPNKKENINSKYYIFKNNEPSIKELEVFISKNINTMSEEDRQMLELVRQKRISELMAKKYLTIISSHEEKENKNKTNH